MNARIVIITNGNYFARLILENVINRYTDDIKGILIITGDYRGNTSFRALWEVGRETAFPYLVYKVISLLLFKIGQRLKPQAVYSVYKQAELKGIPIEHLKSVKSFEAIEWVRCIQPDILVSVSCPQLIGRMILESADLGGINIHSSLLPTYAGLAPYFWVLSNGEKETGTTVHYMNLRFDEGNILVQRRLQIKPGESAFNLFKRLAHEGKIALEKAVEMALDGDLGVQQDLSNFSYYSNPSYKAYKELKKNGHALMRFEELLDTMRGEQSVVEYDISIFPSGK